MPAHGTSSHSSGSCSRRWACWATVRLASSNPDASAVVLLLQGLGGGVEQLAVDDDLAREDVRDLFG